MFMATAVVDDFNFALNVETYMAARIYVKYVQIPFLEKTVLSL